MKQCSKCNYQNNDDALFCVNCGTKLVVSNPTHVKNRNAGKQPQHKDSHQSDGNLKTTDPVVPQPTTKVVLADKLLTNISGAQSTTALGSAVLYTQKMQQDYHYNFDISHYDDLYNTEQVEILFYNHAATLLSAEIIIITNFRLFEITNFSDFMSQPTAEIIKQHAFMDDLEAIKRKETSLEITSNDGKVFIFKSSNTDDQNFVTNSISDKIQQLNQNIVKARNKVTQAIQTEHVENVTEEETNQAESSTTSRINIGPMPDNYEYQDMVFTQAENINWISENGDFVRAMTKICDQFNDMLAPGERIFNFRYSSQNMGNTYSVSAVGDLCRPKKE